MFSDSSSLYKEAFITSSLWQVYCYYYMKKKPVITFFHAVAYPHY